MKTYTKEQENKYIEKIREIVKTHPNGSYANAFNKELKEFILNKTFNLKNTERFKYTLATRLYWILNDIKEFPHCNNKECINKDNEDFYYIHKNVITIDIGYRKHCCALCARKDKETVEIEKQNNFLKYGVEFPQQLDSVKKKQKETVKRNRETDSNYQKKINEKRNKTIEELLKENPNYYKDIRNKATQTYFKKTGYLHPLQNPDVIAAKIEKNNELFGTDWFCQTKEFKEKSLSTLSSNFGVDHPSKSIEIKKKREKTFLSRTGYRNNFENPNWKKDVEDAREEKTGYRNAAQNPEIITKAIEKREYHRSLGLVKSHIKNSYVYDGFEFDSTPELCYYIWLKDNKIDFEYHPNISFKYSYDGKEHKYYPDFKVKDKIIEIKGDQFFNEDGTMRYPYFLKNDSKEYRKYLDEICEAKHQCMLKNNVKILKYAEYSKFIFYVEDKYGKSFLEQYKKSNIKT